jgi:hypothetical protein
MRDDIIAIRREASKNNSRKESLRTDRINVLLRILNDIGVHVNTESELNKVVIPRETLLDSGNIGRMFAYVEELKRYYSSDILNCLHSNALER